MPANKPAKKKETEPFVVAEALLGAFATSDRINRFLIERLDEAAWRAEPPTGKGRTIAAIVAPLHNVRLMWLKVAAAKGTQIPDKLNRDTVTRDEALKALVESYDAIARVLSEALATDGRIRGFKPDVCGFIGYLVSHDAHHRGQVSMLARQTGHTLPQGVMFGMWEWGVR